MVLDGVQEKYHAHRIFGGIRHWHPPFPDWGAAGGEAAVDYMKNATVKLFHLPRSHLKYIEFLYQLAPQHRLLIMCCLSESQRRTVSFFVFLSQCFIFPLSIFINSSLEVCKHQRSPEEMVYKGVGLISR